MGERKNQSELSSQEKQDFVDAVLALKSSGKYDQFVQMHVDAMANPTPSTGSPMMRNSAHRGPAFLPWHREYLRLFEIELQKINPSVNLPYWDWTVDNNLNSSIFSDNFMGGNGNPSNGNRVETGPFAFDNNWELTIDGPALRRTIGSSISSLPTSVQVDDCLSIATYDSAPWDATSDPATSFRNRLEGWLGTGNIHNRVHVWIGGSMTLGSSPNDPLFFLHHCFIDKIWAEWQQKPQSSGYLPTGGTNTGHNLHDQMFPWSAGTTPESVLDISKLGYTYDTMSGGTTHSVNLTESIDVSDDANVEKKPHSSTSKPAPSTSKCFIATAAYGSELEPPVQFLREFRDDVVLQSRFQKSFSRMLDGYYKFSPPIADQMRKHDSLKYLIKYSVVWPFVAITGACALVLQKLGLSK
ncbi:tyrosinase family protein [Candidatus Nitrosopumilus sediminis]|uniref:Tyrosinase n=1 Tax=Candidatus Nitrosopumilus sediminis TaxID=1229909 RepID=K0BA53_9ARCH|nr:tyrosinase family protein [Candidatus Nitrosopumilus sediminis]AFS81917.1 tyrosinase [Candidatus Nitrosopumilus sediminis]